MYELPLEDRRQIKSDLAAKFRSGGLEAAARLVTNYATEEWMIGTYHKAFTRMETSQENLSGTCNLAEPMELVTFQEKVADDYEHAMGRHAYALTTLFDLKSL